MAQQNLDYTAPGESLPSASAKIEANFTELYGDVADHETRISTAEGQLDGTDPIASLNVTTANVTTFKIKDTDASHGLSIVVGSNLTADRTLTITTGDANRVLTLTGDLAMSGAYNATLTFTGATTVTFPTTGTLATLAGAETLTNKRITKRVATLTDGATVTITVDDYDCGKLTTT